MATIAKNRTAYINSIFAGATSILCHHLDNGFAGEECSDPDFIERRVKGRVFAGDATLRSNEKPGSYTVRVHSNLWYEVTSTVHHQPRAKARSQVQAQA